MLKLPAVVEQGTCADGTTPTDKLRRNPPEAGPGSGDGPFKQPLSVSETGQAEQAVGSEDPPQIVQRGR